ncbi:uncharacterized protein E6C27_scaffold86G001810 [Cucumis melo var. makuwa]|uniref:Uncharacterized protein n=1 Tax=Cucumis melo var. makuwa TaxID=1194695 RepID=A0A5A7T2R4_CUCMM|nr:uncharacterized protein E6C27_scaffold86G001810 [Cucumis melo var. makuwa]
MTMRIKKREKKIPQVMMIRGTSGTTMKHGLEEITEDWVKNTENFFKYMDTLERKKIHWVALKLKSSASTWWDQLEVNGQNCGKHPIRSWEKMKKLLKARFPTPNYEQTLYSQFQNCYQGSRSVADYIEEFLRLSARTNLGENEQHRITRFVGGLRFNIKEKASALDVAKQIIYLTTCPQRKTIALADEEYDSVSDDSKALEEEAELIKADDVTTLNLKAEAHPNPYKISWVKKGWRNYGRPWQHDAQTLHKGRENTYEFYWMGKKIRGNYSPLASLPNLAHYQMSPHEYPMLHEHIEDLLEKGHSKSSLSSCAVPALFTPKKDRSWRTCVDNMAINRITVKKFIKNFSSTVAPLTDCLKKGNFKWTLQQQESFNDIKKRLTSSPLLQLLDFTSPFEVAIDACGTGIGAVLSQKGHPVEYFSEKLSPPRQSWSTYEQELYALIRALKQWEYYLLFTAFKHLSDLYIEDADFADTWYKWNNYLKADDYHIVEGFLFKGEQLCIPHTSLREALLKEAHSGGLSGHFGQDKTFEIMSKRYY